jgi:hypothetical protein
MLLQSPRVTRAVTFAPALLREPVARDGFEDLKESEDLWIFLDVLGSGNGGGGGNRTHREGQVNQELTDSSWP